MKVMFVYKVLPAFILYTKKGIKSTMAATARGPVIFIHPDFKGSKGLLVHELTHVKQWYRWLGIGYSLLYKFSKRFQMNMEIEAYREHMKYKEGVSIRGVAQLIKDNSRTSEDVDYIERKLRKNK